MIYAVYAQYDDDGEMIATCQECEGTGKGDFDDFMVGEDGETTGRRICPVCCGFGRLDW